MVMRSEVPLRSQRSPKEVPWKSRVIWLSQFGKRAAAEAGARAETRRDHVPGAEALVDCELIVPGLKSRPISEARFAAACKAMWSPLKIAPTIFPLVRVYAFERIVMQTIFDFWDV